MKNKDIITTVQAGVLEMTTYCLDAAAAYRVYRFRKDLRAAFARICNDEQALLAEAGINDLPAFNVRVEQLGKLPVPSYEESQEMDALLKQRNAYMALRDMMLNEDSQLTPPMLDYEAWRNMQGENRELKLTGRVEELLEGVLWCPPQQ